MWRTVFFLILVFHLIPYIHLLNLNLLFSEQFLLFFLLMSLQLFLFQFFKSFLKFFNSSLSTYSPDPAISYWFRNSFISNDVWKLRRGAKIVTLWRFTKAVAMARKMLLREKENEEEGWIMMAHPEKMRSTPLYSNSL